VPYKRPWPGLQRKMRETGLITVVIMYTDYESALKVDFFRAYFLTRNNATFPVHSLGRVGVSILRTFLAPLRQH
jgi:hypothetical protein